MSKSLRPWDPQTDLFQYESNFKIMTKVKHNIKLPSQCIASPRSSLLTLHHRQTPHLRHPIVPDVVESNECIVTNESYDLLVQYNDIKQRLDHIEDNLSKLGKKIDSSMQITSTNQTNQLQHQQHNVRQTQLNEGFFSKKEIQVNESFKKQHLTKNSQTNELFTKTNLFVALLAWLIGLISAVLSQYLFKK